MKRLGIFCTYDSEGIVDDYIVYLLQEAKKVLSWLVVICNGTLTPEGRERLEVLADELHVRPNSGFDIEAWRQAILQKKNQLADYDELLLFNNSFYGPFYPLAEVFDKMDEKPDADFWGITIHGQMPDELHICPYGYIPEHLQSYFLVIRSRLLHSKEFFSYWKNSDEAETFNDAIRFHEVGFTKEFFERGYRYAAYCDTRDWEKIYDINIDHSIISSEVLLKTYRCPIIKKKAFLVSREHFLRENYGDEPRKSLEYIRDNTGYDVGMIWQNLLRKQNIADTKAHLGLDYILPKNITAPVDKNILKQTAIIAHLYYEDLMPECVDYLKNIPPEVTLIVTVSSIEKKARAKKLFLSAGCNADIRLVSNRGRDLSALLVGCADAFKNFKYLCFVHDKKSIRQNESVAVGRAFFRLLWGNVLGSAGFIQNIIHTFESEPNLGLLVPPQPYNGGYKVLFFVAKFWSGACFDKTVELAEKLGIPKNFVDADIAPLSLGSVFWCRTDALKNITDAGWKIDDFPDEPMPLDGTVSHALERILPFAAQAAGFYTGWLMTSDFVRDEIENYIHFAVKPDLPPPPPVPPAPDVTLTNLVKLNVPQKYWFMLKPVKKLLEKLGFKP